MLICLALPLGRRQEVSPTILFPVHVESKSNVSYFSEFLFVADAHQVFELLETIYGALDKIAKKRRIFKVETVGYAFAAIVFV